MTNTDSQNSTIVKNSIVTIGTFDGVHVGHQEILKQLIDISENEKLASVVLTFFPHPRMVLQKDSKIKLLNTIDERQDILAKTGIDRIVVQKFTKEYSRLTAFEFIRDILVNKLHAKIVVVGYDHHFGRNRSANIEDLREYGLEYDFKVIEIPAKDIANVAVSSTKIRKAITEGDVTIANKYLGYNFMLTGTIVKGNSLGKTINFPTANIEIKENYKLVPKKGVYIVSSNIDGKDVFGMMNIGKKPTVKGKKKTIEVHFFDFDQDIYGKKLQVNLLKRIRNEEKFDSIQDLQHQLKKDKEAALEFIESIKNE
ncbi:MAG: bifunctional riboflavin kinase/FAD synthetase [Flavobacteriaceae bacterium]|nr:bifunctional riboflavin kinase/FAD synthetase [Flavobacteriaceae bacterium]